MTIHEAHIHVSELCFLLMGDLSVLSAVTKSCSTNGDGTQYVLIWEFLSHPGQEVNSLPEAPGHLVLPVEKQKQDESVIYNQDVMLIKRVQTHHRSCQYGFPVN